VLHHATNVLVYFRAFPDIPAEYRQLHATRLQHGWGAIPLESVSAAACVSNEYRPRLSRRQHGRRDQIIAHVRHEIYGKFICDNGAGSVE
jgi:hypothetical protein